MMPDPKAPAGTALVHHFANFSFSQNVHWFCQKLKSGWILECQKFFLRPLSHDVHNSTGFMHPLNSCLVSIQRIQRIRAPNFQPIGTDFYHFWDQCNSVEKQNRGWGGGGLGVLELGFFSWPENDILAVLDSITNDKTKGSAFGCSWGPMMALKPPCCKCVPCCDRAFQPIKPPAFWSPGSFESRIGSLRILYSYRFLGFFESVIVFYGNSDS